MINKRTLFNILVALVSLDIGLTIMAVGFLGASEINPLCDNFSIFMTIKIAVSAIGLFAISKLRDTPGWIIFVGMLIVLYAGDLVFNLTSILNTL